LGFAVACALRYGIKPFSVKALDEKSRQHLEVAWKHPIDESLDRLAEMQRWPLDRAEEARTLATSLSF
jgi:hypothetical protein